MVDFRRLLAEHDGIGVRSGEVDAELRLAARTLHRKQAVFLDVVVLAETDVVRDGVNVCFRTVESAGKAVHPRKKFSGVLSGKNRGSDACEEAQAQRCGRYETVRHCLLRYHTFLIN